MSNAQDPKAQKWSGPLAWFAKNSVAANIIMVVLLLGGYLKMKNVKQEVFPEFDLDIIVITVPYPGASPAEVEQGVALAAEEAVRGVDGIKRVSVTANEGVASVVVELLMGTDPDRALNDVKAAIDRVTSFPENAERPNVTMLANRFQVISMVIYGDQSEAALRALAEKARNDLLRDERINNGGLPGVLCLQTRQEADHRDGRLLHALRTCEDLVDCGKTQGEIVIVCRIGQTEEDLGV